MFTLNAYLFSNGLGGNDIAIHARNLTHAQQLLGLIPFVYWEDFGKSDMGDWHHTEVVVLQGRKKVEDYDFKEFWCLNFVA